jgi:hypothetical protein
MVYKEITIKSKNKESVETEVMFEIAAARADNIELLCVVFSAEDEQDVLTKTKSVITRKLKAMKQAGLIQFFTDTQAFTMMTTEADFLLNKYPDVFSDKKSRAESDCIYIRI